LSRTTNTKTLVNSKRLLYDVHMEQQALVETAKMTCPKGCDSICAKAGKRADGLQRYRCGNCGKTFSDHKEQDSVFGTKQAVDNPKALLALQLLVEGNSIRSTERITGIHRDTIMSLLVKAGQRCEAVLAEKIQNVPVTDVQCDENLGIRRQEGKPSRVWRQRLSLHWRCMDVHRNRTQ
jgi:transposase-like protein